jgi:hypothetical protein
LSVDSQATRITSAMKRAVIAAGALGLIATVGIAVGVDSLVNRRRATRAAAPERAPDDGLAVLARRRQPRADHAPATGTALPPGTGDAVEQEHVAARGR